MTTTTLPAAVLASLPLAVLLATALNPGIARAAAVAGAGCPDYVRHSPGGDYNSVQDRQGLGVVEQFHFTPQVASLSHGATGHLGGDIGYTLEHFPNHAKALAALAKLGLRDKSPQPTGARFTIACFFERAIRFAPQDARVRTTYGAYLQALGQADAALDQLREAVRLDPDNPTIHYNLGLLYLKKKDYALARQHAVQAYAQDFPFPGLRNQLRRAGQWQDAPPPPPAVPDPDQQPAASPGANAGQ